MKDKIIQIASERGINEIRNTEHGERTYKSLSYIEVDGLQLPVLLVGSVHVPPEDGLVIMIVNAEESLVNEIQPGCAYSPGILKKIVAGRCDAAVELNVDNYTPDGHSVVTTYNARNPAMPRFTLDLGHLVRLVHDMARNVERYRDMF